MAIGGSLGGGLSGSSGSSTSVSAPIGPSAQSAAQLFEYFKNLGPQAQSLIASYLSGGPSGELQNYLGAIRSQAQQSFNTTVLPQINRAAQQGGGFFSSGRINQLQRAGQGFAQGLGEALSGPALQELQNRTGIAQNLFGLGQGISTLYGGTAGKQKQSNFSLSGALTGGLLR